MSIERRGTRLVRCLVADSIEAVVALAQMGIVEIHTWNSVMEDIERPNRIVWDLDPGPAATVKAGRQSRRSGAHRVEDARSDVVGGGLHVVVPIKAAREVGDHPCPMQRQARRY